MSKFLTGLNGPQAEAVAYGCGPLLVFAGAGSGKTRVITVRTARIVEELGADPSRMLLVTFTNKASAEMKERMVPLVGKAATKAIWAGTFHSVGARILRTYAELVDRARDFVIYDDSDQETVVKQVINEEKLDKKYWSPSHVLKRIQDAKQKAYMPSDIPIVDQDMATFVKLYDRYERWLIAGNAFDFDDLILYPMRLAEGGGEVGREIRGRFDHVLVDEFQDTNATQYRLVRALAQTRNLCVVGDDDQCIYTWRGADVGNIRGFHKNYPDARVVKLEQNYRSTQRIVAAAMGVIEQSRIRTPKRLFTANPAGAKVRVIEFQTDRSEASAIVRQAKRLRAAGLAFGQMAVLYRTHAQSRTIEDALRDAQVGYRIVGGARFYERKEVKDVLAYLRLIAHPTSDVDLLRIINVPARGIGATTTNRLRELAISKKLSLWAALPEAMAAAEIGRKERLNIKVFRDVLENFRKTMGSDRPSELTLRVIEAVGLRKMWLDAAKLAAADGKLAESDDLVERARNVDEVCNAVAAYEKRMADEGEVASLGGYLQAVTLAMQDDPAADDRVTLMTVHAAKGLEFEQVFLVGLEEGRFPLGDATMKPLELEEERRLCYVAITRARRGLWITHVMSRFVRGRPEWQSPSRFIQDLPADAIDRLSHEAYDAERREQIRAQA